MLWFNFILGKTVLKTRYPSTINLTLDTKTWRIFTVEGTGVFLYFDCIVACVANVSARVQPSVRYYSSVFDSVFATVMTVLVLKSVLREICYGAIYSRLQGLGSYGCV